MVTATAASAVNDAYAVLHLGDGLSVNHVLCFLGQRGMNGDIVRALEQRVQIY